MHLFRTIFTYIVNLLEQSVSEYVQTYKEIEKFGDTIKGLKPFLFYI